MKNFLIALVLILNINLVYSQTGYWQQHVDYKMTVKLNTENHRYNGTTKLTYTNNSPDTLTKVFFHLYFNAFQPGSMMDVRSRSIADPDNRVTDRISKLKENEIGYIHVTELKQDGKSISGREEGTILTVTLAKPILPGASTLFDFNFNGQVPQQIRRSGRNNSEGISYSMSQWYPKIAEYDEDGWHPNPYIAREFYGVWGDFDVSITLDKNYTIGGSGYLQNKDEIGHGYSDKVVENKKKELTWHFKAPNVHDFMWAADPDYTHVIYPMENGPELHFYYQKGDETAEWEKLPEYTAKAIEYMNTHFGVYPYEQFSVVQGGDGGMEYPMSTLITGHRRLGSLVGVTVHELIHSWYQGVLGTNESLYPWMDEGFTSYASSLVMQYLFETDKSKNPLEGSYKGYFYNVSQGEEPLTMHSDQYSTNRSYGLNAYSKGAVFLHQLSYVVGQETFMKGMRNYFNTWKFKHPDAKDFIRIMEKESGMVLDWYIEQFVYSTNSIDYSIENVEGKKGNTIVTLKRIGNMMMPIDLYITKKDGSQVLYYIPLRIMRGSKKIENTDIPRVDMDNWPWTNETYTMELPFEIDSIESMEIDTSKRLADVKPENNMWKK